MSQRQIFPGDYEAFCKRTAPFDVEEDLLRATSGDVAKKIVLQPQFWREIETFFNSTFKLKLPEHPVKNVSDLLEDSFIVGEIHRDISPKKFLIENMKAFKAAGFERLYMEHLYYDDQKLLDEFFVTGVMDEKLKKHLKELDKGHRMPQSTLIAGDKQSQEVRAYYEAWNKYNFTAIFKAAQAAGIRIVAGEIKAVYESQHLVRREADIHRKAESAESSTRMQTMNFTMQTIINREEKHAGKEKGKWLALMGATHVHRQFDVPGVAEIFGVTGIYFFDTKKEQAPSVTFQTKKEVGKFSLTCDICVETGEQAEALKLESREKNLEKKQ